MARNSQGRAIPSAELFPTTDGHERTLAPVTVRARYHWAERNRQLLEAKDLQIEEDDIPISGIRRGLGNPRKENNYVPEDVWGFSVRHPDIRKEANNGATYGLKKTYLSPFYQSILASLTTTERLWDNDGGYQTARLPSPTRIVDYLNKNIFRRRIFAPCDFQYRDKDGNIVKQRAIEAYSMVAKVILLDIVNSRRSNNWQSRCVICWQEGTGTCDDCDVRITSVNHDTPVESLFPIVKDAHMLLPTKVSNSIAGNIRQLLRQFLDEESKVWAIAPGFDQLYGNDSMMAEEIKNMVGEPPLEPMETFDSILDDFRQLEQL